MVQDYYHNLSSQLLFSYLEPDNENAEPIPVGALINGQSSASFDLTAGQNHRLRIINVGAFATFEVNVDKHDFAITEADGTDLHPVLSDMLTINPAQRYSIILSANDTERSASWLHARMNTHCFAEQTDSRFEALAQIRYHSDQETTDSVEPDPTSPLSAECGDMSLSSFKPVQQFPAPSKPDASFYIRTNFEIGAHRLSRGFFNSSSFRPENTSPALHRMISGIEALNTSFSVLTPPPEIIPTIFGPHPFPPLQDHIGVNTAAYDSSKELVIQTPTTGKVLDFIFVNFDDGSHPLHLHGHKFWVLGQGKGYPPESIMNLAGEEPRDEAAEIDLSNPLRRDTAVVQAFAWMHIRVLLDNPGMWLFHCHVAWHAEAGMGMMLAVGVEDIAKQVHNEDGGWVQAIESQKGICSSPGIDRGQRPPDSTWA
ncbi:hypothetical protein PV11_09785 [Exophiala sideris]|uniref:Plastocyanin-like domain-containing protein n=1 Tax=Exophiala sideris TaxID=1016849 RepID=A0A0D1YT29_9EURO|nr:hypothetical protein PV11_09785 [Exophiala sideris]